MSDLDTGVALCAWRYSARAAPEAPGSQGGPCPYDLSCPLYKSHFLAAQSFGSTAWCQGWTGPWAPAMARCGPALTGTELRPPPHRPHRPSRFPGSAFVSLRGASPCHPPDPRTLQGTLYSVTFLACKGDLVSSLSEPTQGP